MLLFPLRQEEEEEEEVVRYLTERAVVRRHPLHLRRRMVLVEEISVVEARSRRMVEERIDLFGCKVNTLSC